MARPDRFALLWLALLLPVSATAQDGLRSARVAFEAGADSAVLEGRIEGDAAVDYVLGAAQGQAARISMEADNPSAYFNVLPPGSDGEAIFIGSTLGNDYAGILPASGDYVVRVYLMRNAARRGETARYRLDIMVSDEIPPAAAAASVDVPPVPELPQAPKDGGPRHWEVAGLSGTLNLRAEPSTAAPVLTRYAPGTILDNLGCLIDMDRVWCDVQALGGGPRGYVALDYLNPAVSPSGAVMRGPDLSAVRAGQGDFDATGQIPCAQRAGQPMGACDFGVARAGGGSATVVITHPGGRMRVLYFSNGEPIGTDGSEADPAGPFSASREADLSLVRVGEERYEVPDALVSGG